MCFVYNHPVQNCPGLTVLLWQLFGALLFLDQSLAMADEQ